MNLDEENRSATDEDRKFRRILDHLHKTTVLRGVKSYTKYLKAMNLARLLAGAEEDVAAGRIRPARAFIREFKNAHKIRN